MPCKRKPLCDKPCQQIQYVLGLYDFDPVTYENLETDDASLLAPSVESQLPFTRGDLLIVVSQELDWWLLCKSVKLQKEGYVPTSLLMPLCEISSDKSEIEETNNKKLIVCGQNSVDFKYFPHAPQSMTLQESRKPCPENSANILSRITFWWMTGMILDGYKRPLQDVDLWALPEVNRVDVIGKKLSNEWEKEIVKARNTKKGLLEGITLESEDSGIEEKNVLLVEGSNEKPKAKNGKVEDDENNAEDQEVTFEMRENKGKQKTQKPSLVKALIRAYGCTFLVGAIFKLFHDCLLFANPYILRLIISYIEGQGPQEAWRGYVYAVSLFAVALVQSFVLHQYFHRIFITGMRARSGALSLIYRKMLVLSNEARREFTVGEMVNLMAIDANKLQEITTYLNMIWSAPLQIVISLYFLYDTMGWSIFAGVAMMLLLMPVNFFVSKKTKALQVKQMKKKDIRSKMVNEVLNGIKVIKLYAWENSFIKKIYDIREKELNQLKAAMYLGAGFSFTYTCAPFMVSVATFAVYVLSGNILTASKAFVAISLFNILRFPMAMLPTLITNLIQCQVSQKRISGFLQAGELDPSAVSYSKDSTDPVAVKVENGSFSWGDDGNPTLSNINLTVERYSITAVVGTVGSGKSSLLSALLGEMKKITGSVSIKGKIAYVPQQAWIQNATLLDNILFGKQHKAKAYEKVIDACALRTDLDILPVGDLTEIGEKGINLSGGQKQRVSLARAVYSDADIYLFDDPLSAVDAHVAKHIFDEVIGPNGILKDKVRILVTNGLSYLIDVDRIVVLNGGTIRESGSYRELVENDEGFAEFLRTYLIEAGEDLDSMDEDAPRMDTLIAKVARRLSEESLVSPRLEEDTKQTHSCNNELPNAAEVKRLALYSGTDVFDDNICELLHQHAVQEALSEKKKGASMVKAETAETGRVKIGVFYTYAKAMGVFVALLIILSSIIYEGLAVGSRIWLARWTSLNVTTEEETNINLAVYGGLGVLQAIFVLLNAFLLAFGAFRASRDLHNKLLISIFHSVMWFFETTPMGRIVNRFSSDMNRIDEVIPFSIKSFIGTLASVCSTMFVISFATPIFLAVLFPLLIFYVVTQRFYVTTSRQLKRLEAVKKSPIYNHFFESINGVSTIRAYKEEERFIEDTDSKVDENQTAYYPSISANRWLAVRLEFIGNCIVLAAALFAVNSKDKLSPGLVGLSITYALSVTQTLNWMVRMTSELETNIVSVERVKEYTDTPKEASWEIQETKPSEEWPDKGAISFDNYSVRYREGLDLVLKDLQCDIRQGEKVGIVGRTGAGKSSITMALFRIIEAAGGKIEIDGVHLSSIGLHDLRSKLTIIPQDPVLFSGSLRFNLDPFSKYTDDELWYALEVAHLKTFVSDLEAKLEHEILEGGENLSVGQRQLICLARALLRKTRVLVLDEATAAVDMETDELIQGTIRREFKDCTILTIAHRLNTIIDYDRIMLLDKGSIVEFSTPTELLADKSSRFYAMAKDAGIVW